MIRIGDDIEIVGIEQTIGTTCIGIEMFRKTLDQGEAGDNVGILLRGVDKNVIERGRVLCKPKSLCSYSSFIAEIYTLKKKKDEDILRSLTNTNLNSTLELSMWQVLFPLLKGWKW